MLACTTLFVGDTFPLSKFRLLCCLEDIISRTVDPPPSSTHTELRHALPQVSRNITVYKLSDVSRNLRSPKHISKLFRKQFSTLAKPYRCAEPVGVCVLTVIWIIFNKSICRSLRQSSHTNGPTAS